MTLHQYTLLPNTKYQDSLITDLLITVHLSLNLPDATIENIDTTQL